MCGICGSLSLCGRPVDPVDVRRMLASMIHRGPDSEGLFTKPGVAAGVRRLAVIDTESGDQPLTNEDGSVLVVFNGEIYNFRELRSELEAQGHVFRTQSDTETLVHLWEEHGTGMLDRLNGMFAFCLHDTRSGQTLIARDRLGIKPLYYWQRGDVLAFASELAVLLRHRESPSEVSPAGLAELFLLQYLPGRGTLYPEIVELPPGHLLHVEGGAAQVSRWYEIPDSKPTEAEGPELLVELRELLESSVRYRRIADVPLGVFLSGGLDSSIVTWLLAGISDQPVRTFSVGFEDEAAFDERQHARRVADELETDHHELQLSAVDIADYLPRLVAHLAQPVADPAFIPTYLLSEFARRRVTVVLTGEGADELFGGYRRYLYQQRFGWLARVPGARLAGEGPLQERLPRRMKQALDAVHERDPVRAHVEWSSTLGGGLARELFDEGLLQEVDRRIHDEFSPYFDSDRLELSDQLRADQHQWLPHNLLAKVDRASMAFSLEARVPFLDHRLVEWAARLPDEHKIAGRTTKRILREAFRERLPRSILERPKQGFDLPLDAWIRGPLAPMARDLLAPSSLARWDGVRPSAVTRMLERHLAGEQSFGLPLFLAVSVMTFLDRSAPTS